MNLEMEIGPRRQQHRCISPDNEENSEKREVEDCDAGLESKKVKQEDEELKFEVVMLNGIVSSFGEQIRPQVCLVLRHYRVSADK